MHKVADTDELQRELRRILAYAQTERPSRARLANELSSLGRRVAGQYSLTAFKRAVSARNIRLIKTMVEELRRSRFSEKEIYRLALAGDDQLTQDEWQDIIA